MDISFFTENSPGSLVKINVEDKNDWAFVPDPLPDHWNPSDNIWPLLIQAHEELARLDGIGRYMPNYELLLQPLQRREAIRSSSLEGTYATPKQLLLYQMDPKEPKSTSDPVNAWREVANYNSALEAGLKLLEKLPFSLRLIREIHKKLLEGVRGHQRDPGNFRRTQVHIGSDRRFIPPPPNRVAECLDGFEKYINKISDIDPLIFCIMVHYQFEAIHPFLDGNGRVGRLLLALMVYKWCHLSRPWLYLSAYFERYKDEYLRGLFDISANGNWEKWIVYCLRGMIAQTSDAIKRLDGLLALKDEYERSVVNGGASSLRFHRTIEQLFKFPIISIPFLAQIHSTTYPTAKADIDFLIKVGILEQIEVDRRPKIYLAPKIIDLAYGESDENDTTR